MMKTILLVCLLVGTALANTELVEGDSDSEKASSSCVKRPKLTVDEICSNVQQWVSEHSGQYDHPSCTDMKALEGARALLKATDVCFIDFGEPAPVSMGVHDRPDDGAHMLPSLIEIEAQSRQRLKERLARKTSTERSLKVTRKELMGRIETATNCAITPTDFCLPEAFSAHTRAKKQHKPHKEPTYIQKIKQEPSHVWNTVSHKGKKKMFNHNDGTVKTDSEKEIGESDSQ